MYKIFHVGGNPADVFLLANNLSNKVDEIQSHGWTIERIDLITNTQAWDVDKQEYVETPEYIICAKNA